MIKTRESNYPNIATPSRIKGWENRRLSLIASGPSAFHCLLVDEEGSVFTFGRNNEGQLGHGDTVTRHEPTLVESLKGKRVVAASCGRAHTVVLTEDGESWAWCVRDVLPPSFAVCPPRCFAAANLGSNPACHMGPTA